jgi:glycosyltransferase involved in cell wall biosynthesis
MARNVVTAIQLARLVRRWRCDAVYTNTIVVPIGSFAAVLAGKPHVWHIHEFGTLDHGLKFDWGEKVSLSLIGRLSAVCVTNSTIVNDHFARWIDPRKLRVVYCSMQLAPSRRRVDEYARELTHSSAQAFRCVLVGRLIGGKGQEDAVLAVAELAKNGVNTELILVGDGSASYIERLKGHVARYELQDRIIFTGRLQNPAAVVSCADAVLMCSRCEAFGRVTVEGMLAGKPVIGARAGATPELIDEGVNGLLYTPGDHHELAAHIKYLSDNRAEAARMGRNAHKWAQSIFSEERLAQELLATLSGVIEPIRAEALTV